MLSLTVNDYLDQIRFRAQKAEVEFGHAIDALNRSQTAAGTLRSGATIKKTLRLIADDFDKLTHELLTYLARTLSRTDLDRADLLSLTAQILQSSKSAFVSLMRTDRLCSFAQSKSVDQVIDEALRELDQRLTLRLREFSFGLSDIESTSAPIAPAADRYVTIRHNEVAELSSQLAELRELVRGENDAEEEDRQVALSEIAAF